MELAWVVVVGKVAVGKLIALITVVKDLIWIFSGLAILTFAIDKIKVHSTGYIWTPWVMVIGKSVLVEPRQRVITHAWPVWGPAIGRCTLGLVTMLARWFIWMVPQLYVVIRTSLNSIRNRRQFIPAAASPPYNPNRTQTLEGNNVLSQSSGPDTLETLHSDSDGRPRTREPYVQALVNQGSMGVVYADELLVDEPGSGTDLELTSGPRPTRGIESMPEQAPAA